MAQPITSVLIVAGTDPLSGAGVVADALTCRDHGIHPLVVETAWVDQDSHGVHRVEPTHVPGFVERLRRVLCDAEISAVKIGLLATSGHARALSETLKRGRIDVPIVLDPVLAGGANGAPMTDAMLVDSLNAFSGERTVWTPNRDELAALLKQTPARDLAEMENQARRWHRQASGPVLAKGGHLNPPGTDLLVDRGRVRSFPPTAGWSERDVHGTGCHLSTAVACNLAVGKSVERSIERARSYLGSLTTARVGKGRPQFVRTKPCGDALG